MNLNNKYDPFSVKGLGYNNPIEPKAKEVKIFKYQHNDVVFEISEEEYLSYQSKGLTEPFVIDDKLIFLSKNEIELLEKKYNEIKKLGLKLGVKIPKFIKNKK